MKAFSSNGKSVSDIRFACDNASIVPDWAISLTGFQRMQRHCFPRSAEFPECLQVFSDVCTLCRINRGISYRKSKLPKKPIDLWAYEASPFCKLAREVDIQMPVNHMHGQGQTCTHPEGYDRHVNHDK